jgi:hypothetical protein
MPARARTGLKGNETVHSRRSGHRLDRISLRSSRKRGRRRLGSIGTHAGHEAPMTVEERLRRLDRLYDSGAISKSEYERRRRELIDAL